MSKLESPPLVFGFDLCFGTERFDQKLVRGKKCVLKKCLVNGLSTIIIKFDFGTNKVTFSLFFFCIF